MTLFGVVGLPHRKWSCELAFTHPLGITSLRQHYYFELCRDI